MESNNNDKFYHLFVKLLDGKTLTLRFPSPHIYTLSVKHRLYEITRIPPRYQRLITGVRNLNDEESVISSTTEGGGIFPTVHLLLRLIGGKGGFGSLLRGAGTKAGQKKTNNFDACRDMSGRRLRHVNAEKKLEEWKAEEEERRLEKMADEFLKKAAKKGKKGVGECEAQKYVAKYREESERCTAEVAESVREALMSGNGKRKGHEATKDAAEAKKIKIWKGKRKLGESDSDDSDEDESNEEEKEKSVVLNSGNQSDSNKETEESSDSVTGRKQDGKFSGLGSCESGSEEEKEIVVQQGVVEPGGSRGGESFHAKASKDKEIILNTASESVISGDSSVEAEKQNFNGPVSVNLDVGVSQVPSIPSSEKGEDMSASADMEADGSSEFRVTVHEESGASASIAEIETPLSIAEIETPLDFGSLNSAAELEVLGMERLKSELQAHGLKCGGTLQQRAARLFLLKSTPLDKFPKKLLAKK
ncbi:Protein SDE2-like protein [Quillaja saponaria]|uniref:Protein SDE2-like protein n=1 Tax=Quillaja saponaria TaxID=32244 RepID=A0AAD7PD87_QUISA|nr:Protein SDE2-like protein [Quillaja saponaria]